MTDTGAGFELRAARKEFGATVAVHDLDLAVEPGTVHALVGENGAGKSTAARILAGVHSPTAGEIVVDGVRVTLGSAVQAEAMGIVLIPQELQLYPSLSVAENMFVGRARPRNRAGLVSVTAMRDRSRGVLERLGIDVAPEQLVERLPYGTRQLVAIARALSSDVRLLIMDEPTAALDEWESRRLLDVVRDLRRSGVAVLYVSHRMHEIMSIADRVTVMRDGLRVATGPVGDYDRDSLVEHMVGRKVELLARSGGGTPGDVVLRTRGFTQEPHFRDVNLEVRAGEVVGLAGIVGSGRSELAMAIYGRTAASGELEIDGVPLPRRSIRTAIRRGLGLVPEERQAQGLFLPLTVAANAAVLSMRRLRSGPLLSGARERRFAEEVMARFSFRAHVDDPVESLSGGNQQKVLLARWLSTDPTVIILDEPTRGIDVGARAEIYQAIDELASRGVAILVISSDIQEVLLLSDRILVMRTGEVVAEFSGDERTELSVGAAALGKAVAS